MEMSGEYRIPAPREDVWDKLIDPEVLRACIPGCESLEKTADNQFNAVVSAKIGPVKAKFKGTVELTELDRPNGYKIQGEGKGGAAGFAKGGATVSLADEDGATRLTYQAEAKVGGKLAQVGSRLVKSSAKKMADEFFDKFAELAGGEAVAAPEAEGAEQAAAVAEASVVSEAAASASTPAPAEKARGLSPMLWLGILIIAALVLVLLFG